MPILRRSFKQIKLINIINEKKDYWQCNKTKELKHFIIDGVLHYENSNECYFQDLFGANEEHKT